MAEKRKSAKRSKAKGKAKATKASTEATAPPGYTMSAMEAAKAADWLNLIMYPAIRPALCTALQDDKNAIRAMDQTPKIVSYPAQRAKSRRGAMTADFLTPAETQDGKGIIMVSRRWSEVGMMGGLVAACLMAATRGDRKALKVAWKRFGGKRGATMGDGVTFGTAGDAAIKAAARKAGACPIGQWLRVAAERAVKVAPTLLLKIGAEPAPVDGDKGWSANISATNWARFEKLRKKAKGRGIKAQQAKAKLVEWVMSWDVLARDKKRTHGPRSAVPEAQAKANATNKVA